MAATTVFYYPHNFPSDPQGFASQFWPQASAVFLEEFLGKTRVK